MKKKWITNNLSSKRQLNKLLRFMKIATLFIIACTLNLHATVYSQNTKFSYDFRGKTVREVFTILEKNSKFRFFYNDNFNYIDQKVDIVVKDQNVEEILAKMLSSSEMTYRVLDNNLVVLTPLESMQSITIKGKVTDANGAGLPGVNIIVKGTTIGTTTDMDGNYTLEITNANSVLVFSYIGYLTEEVNVQGRNNISVTLIEDVKNLEEVVVVGYGTQKKREVTSAVASVKEEDFNKGAIVSSPLQLVQGKVAGLAISRSNGGDPNSGVQMQLRGVSTVRGTEDPLVIIDGVPGGNLNTISPEDIESIDVLRDGSAAAIYGTRGTNGVVIITTKKGKAGKPTVEYSAYVYTESFSKKPEVLTADEWRKLKVDFQNSTNQALKDKAGSIVDYGGNTDWFEEITRQSLSHVHNLSISGGNEKTNYYASVNYRNLQGMVKRSYNDFLNGRLSIAHLGMNDKLKVEMSLANTFRKSRPTDYGVYRQAMQRNPTLPVYNEDGTYREESGWELFNPVAQIYQNENDQQRNELLASVRGTYEIVKDLKVSVLGAMQKYNDLMGSYAYRTSFASVQGGYNGEASRSSGQSVDRTLESTVNYNKSFGGVHSLSLMGGYSYQDFMWESFGARNRYFITDGLTYNNLGAGLHLQDGTFKDGDVWSNKNSSKLIAFFGRAIYSFDDKYMFSASLRREGSSKFGENHKWGMFPSVTAGWRLSKENFMSGLTWLSDLKLRVGYGVTGNQGIVSYESLERMSTAGMMLYEGKWIKGYAPSSNPNPDLRWEKKAETNFGVDFGLFDNRITANLDIYNRNTTDLIYNYPVPVPPNLYGNIWTNVGEVSNKGVEFTINATPVKSARFSWNTNFNISYNKNKLVSLSNDLYQVKYQDLENIGAPGLNSTPGYRLEEGQPIGNMFGFVFAGFTDDGKWLFWDKDHKNKLLASEVKYEDKKVIGNGLPKYWMGFTNTFNYGNFDLTVFLRGTFGFHLMNTQRIFFENRYMVPVNILKDALKSPVVADPQFSDYYVEKGDYVKLDNVTLGYTFPVKNRYLQKARIYFATQNLMTFTKYKGQDPELQIMGLTPGMDRRWSYPATRTFSLGINVLF